MQTQQQHTNLNMPAVSPTIDPTVDPDIMYKSQTVAALAPPDKQLSGSDLSSCSHYNGPPPPGPEVAQEYSGTRRPGVKQSPQSIDSKRNGYSKQMPWQNLGLSDNTIGADEGQLPELHKVGLTLYLFNRVVLPLGLTPAFGSKLTKSQIQGIARNLALDIDCRLNMPKMVCCSEALL